MIDLFRPEALQNTSARLQGTVMLGVGRIWALFAYTCVFVILAILVFLSTASYTRKESVTGWIVPQDGLIRVQARSGGTIQSIAVQEGDLVRAGQVLATFRSSADLPDGNSGILSEREITTELEGNAENSRAQIARLEAGKAQMLAQQKLLRQQRAASQAAIEIAKEKKDLADQHYARITAVHQKGYLSQHDVDMARSGVLSAEQEISTAQATLAGIDQQLAANAGELAAFPSQIREIESQSTVSGAISRQKLQDVSSRTAFVVTAPITGRIVAIPVEVGQTVSPDAAVFLQVPADENLEVELYVPSKAAGFIRPGQSVGLKYQAFPYQKFGVAQGKISHVSRTVLGASDLPSSAPKVDEPVFRVRVTVGKAFVRAYGADIPLQPGMLVNADIITDRRSLLEWLFDPIYAVAKH